MSAENDTPPEDEALATALKALAHPKRLRLLRFLTEPHHLEEIASELGVARQSAQEHVHQLLSAGVLEAVPGKGQRGMVTDYVVATPALFDILDQLGGRVGLLRAELEEHLAPRHRTAVLSSGSGDGRPVDAPRLTIVHGLRVGQTTPLDGGGPWLVGRDPQAWLSLDYDPYVSARHAEIRRVAGRFEVVDAMSSNGTFVDWRRLPRGGSGALAHGSLLRVGKTMLLFRAPS